MATTNQSTIALKKKPLVKKPVMTKKTVAAKKSTTLKKSVAVKKPVALKKPVVVKKPVPVKKNVAAMMLMTNRRAMKLARSNCGGSVNKKSIFRFDIERCSISKPRLKIIEAL